MSAAELTELRRAIFDARMALHNYRALVREVGHPTNEFLEKTLTRLTGLQDIVERAEDAAVVA